MAVCGEICLQRSLSTAKGESSDVQGKRGQGFVLHTLILRVQRKQRTKNCSFDVAMRRFKKKSGRCRAADYEFPIEKKPFYSLFSASSLKQPRPGRALFSLKAHYARAEKKILSAVFLSPDLEHFAGINHFAEITAGRNKKAPALNFRGSKYKLRLQAALMSK